MRKTTIKASAMMLAQVAAGQEVTAIIDSEGTMYLQMVTVKELKGGGSSASEDAEEEADEKPKRGGSKTTPTKGRGRGAKAVDPGDADPEEGNDEDAAEDEKPKGRGRGRSAAKKEEEPADDAPVDEFTEIFKKLEGGKASEDETISDLNELTKDKTIRKALEGVVAKFIENEKLTLKQIVAMAVAAWAGEEAEEEKPKGRGGAKVKSVDIDDLEAGDKVSVLISGVDENDEPVDEWWNAEIKVKRGGKKALLFEDDNSTQDYDPEVHVQLTRAK